MAFPFLFPWIDALVDESRLLLGTAPCLIRRQSAMLADRVLLGSSISSAPRCRNSIAVDKGLRAGRMDGKSKAGPLFVPIGCCLSTLRRCPVHSRFADLDLRHGPLLVPRQNLGIR